MPKGKSFTNFQACEYYFTIVAHADVVRFIIPHISIRRLYTAKRDPANEGRDSQPAYRTAPTAVASRSQASGGSRTVVDDGGSRMTG